MYGIISNFIDNNYLDNLLDEVPFKRDYISINGMKVKENRFTYWMSDLNKSYKYGGKIMKPNKITPTIKIIQNKIKEIYGLYFDSVLVNLYENGGIGMKYHSDETYNEWNEESVVVSFGEERKIIFRDKNNYDNKEEYICKNGDLIYMKDGCQSRFQHKICKNNSNGNRISLVFKCSLT